MILINVLIIVLLATSILAVILAGEQDDADRTQALRSAAQAQATARGAELSAVAALRRDLAAGDVSDNPHEPWANIGDRHARIPGGQFTFTVSDAQALFNINNLARGDSISQANFARIGALAELPPGDAERIGALIALAGPIGDLADLRASGLNENELRRLAELCTALPKPTAVNLNTAPEPLLAVLLGNAAAAHSLMSLRARGDGLTSEQLREASLLVPPGAGFTSDYFWARGRVTLGGTSQQLTSLLFRQVEEGRPAVHAIRRWRGAAPIEAPPLPE
ncbi:MAG: Type II secretory pathway component PulK-like protein [Novosphingobium sp.]